MIRKNETMENIKDVPQTSGLEALKRMVANYKAKEAENANNQNQSEHNSIPIPVQRKPDDTPFPLETEPTHEQYPIENEVAAIHEVEEIANEQELIDKVAVVEEVQSVSSFEDLSLSLQVKAPEQMDTMPEQDFNLFDGIGFITKSKTYIDNKGVVQNIKNLFIPLSFIPEDGLSFSEIPRVHIMHRGFHNKNTTIPTPNGLQGGGSYFEGHIEADNFYILLPMLLFPTNNIKNIITEYGLDNLIGFEHVKAYSSEIGNIDPNHDEQYRIGNEFYYHGDEALQSYQNWRFVKDPQAFKYILPYDATNETSAVDNGLTFTNNKVRNGFITINKVTIDEYEYLKIKIKRISQASIEENNQLVNTIQTQTKRIIQDEMRKVLSSINK